MPILTDAERLGTLVANKYRLETILGRGGMGVVFAGTHTWTGRKVAVKLLKPEYASDPVIAKRFLQEAQSATKIRHPNVVDVLDMGEDTDGTVYLVLDYLEGETLASILSQRGGKLDAEETLEYLLPVMGALAMAHDKGIIHRDLKPENIFISHDATGKTTTKLLDFGIAKVLEGRQDEATRTGQVIGTPHYMSPEQALAAPDIGTQTDVWSIGVVLFECLAGRCPFEGNTATAILLAVTGGKPKRLNDVAPNVPRKLATAIDGALVANRAERYKSMRELVSAIAASLAGTPLAATLLRLATEVSAFHGGKATGTDPHAETLGAGSGGIALVAGDAARPMRKTPFSISNTFLGQRDQRSRKKWLAVGAAGVALVAITVGVLVAVNSGGNDGLEDAPPTIRAAAARGVDVPPADDRQPATAAATTATATAAATSAAAPPTAAPATPSPAPTPTPAALATTPTPTSAVPPRGAGPSQPIPRTRGGATRTAPGAATAAAATNAAATATSPAGGAGVDDPPRTTPSTTHHDRNGTPPALQRNW